MLFLEKSNVFPIYPIFYLLQDGCNNKTAGSIVQPRLRLDIGGAGPMMCRARQPYAWLRSQGWHVDDGQSWVRPLVAVSDALGEAKQNSLARHVGMLA